MSPVAPPVRNVRARPVADADEIACVDGVRQVSGFGPAIVEEMRYLRANALGEVFLAESGGSIVGAAGVAHFGETGWLGGICVRPEARRAGLGTALTEAAVAWLRERGAHTTLLYATDLGRGVYARMGFVEDGGALAWAGTPMSPAALPPGTRIGLPDDLDAVLALDLAASGEDRSAMLRLLWPEGGLVLERDGEIRAAAVARPRGRGRMVVAGEQAAGATLIPAAFAPGPDEQRLTSPAGNRAADRALRRAGLRPMWQCPRMRLGPPVAAHPARQPILFNLFWS